MKTLSVKSLLTVTAALLLVTASATAQQNGGPRDQRGGRHGPPDAEMRVAQMTQALELSDEQSAQLLIVMQEVDPKWKPGRSAASSRLAFLQEFTNLKGLDVSHLYLTQGDLDTIAACSAWTSLPIA